MLSFFYNNSTLSVIFPLLQLHAECNCYNLLHPDLLIPVYIEMSDEEDRTQGARSLQPVLFQIRYVHIYKLYEVSNDLP